MQTNLHDSNTNKNLVGERIRKMVIVDETWGLIKEGRVPAVLELINRKLSKSGSVVIITAQGEQDQ